MDRCGWEAAIAGHGIQLLPIGAEMPSPSGCRMLPWTSAFEDGFTDSMATIGVPYVVASRDSVDLTVCGRPMEIRQCLSDGLGAVVWNTVSGPWICPGRTHGRRGLSMGFGDGGGGLASVHFAVLHLSCIPGAVLCVLAWIAWAVWRVPSAPRNWAAGVGAGLWHG